MTESRSAMSDDPAGKASEVYAAAIGMLARREYAARELTTKLCARGFALQLVERVLERLMAERLQSDERFAESYLRGRSGKGYGPERIRAELRERGIDDSLIAAGFRQAEEEDGIDWFALAETAYAKKYGGRPVEDIKERAKRHRFMQYRGFTHEQIAAAIARN